MKQIRLSTAYGKNVLLKLPKSKSYINSLNKIEGTQTIDNLVQEGISYYAVKPVFDCLSMNQMEQAALIGVETRTISNWVRRDQVLSKTEAMQMIELDRILQLGIEIFGSEESFLIWFNNHNEALGNKSPKELVLRPSGLRIIEEALTGMEFGNIL